MMDQANKLRSLVTNNDNIEADKSDAIKIYSILSGKGGVGKTNFAVNLAIKLQQMGKRVLILDADIGMSNANIILGVEIKYSIFDLLQGQKKLANIIIKTPYGVDLISGGSELSLLENMDDENQQDILKELATLEIYDVLIIDNGAGLTKQSLTFSILSDEIILVTTPEPTAITDAYRILKTISQNNIKDNAKLVVNQIRDISNGDETYEKLLMTSEKFLHLKLEKLGYIFNDIRVNKSIMDQNPIILRYPNALASTNISQICSNLLGDEKFSQNISSIRQFGNKIIRLFG